MATVYETSDYDPRYKRPRTIEGAKARYVEFGNGYGIEDFEADVERLLKRGEFEHKSLEQLANEKLDQLLGPGVGDPEPAISRM